MFYLKMGELYLVGSSPEVMVRVENRQVTVRPIAGTRRRGEDDEEDERLAAELLADPKERAEHIMLVDLGRNDVGRVGKYGTVRADEVMVDRAILARHAHRQQRDGRAARRHDGAGRAEGLLAGGHAQRRAQGAGHADHRRAGGHQRGPYGGAVGYFDFSGNMDTCIAIRTIVMTGGKAYVQAGGGIVADSVPESEYEETLNKARALLRAIQVAEKMRR